MDTSEVAAAYRQFGRLVLRRCRRILRQEHAAEDATQEVFLKLWRYGQSYRHADCKLGWLYRVADRCCFNELHRRQTRREVAQPAERDVAAPAHGLSEDRQLIVRFLGRFEDRVQRVAILHFVEEMTQEEIAAATGWSRQTIHKKLSQVRARAAALQVNLLGARA
jgi:RNA polymerase sigma-70 factor (ECF subfamily)